MAAICITYCNFQQSDAFRGRALALETDSVSVSKPKYYLRISTDHLITRCSVSFDADMASLNNVGIDR